MYTPQPYQRRAWPALVSVGAILALILGCALVALVAALWFDPIAVAERERQAWRQAQIDSQLAGFDLAIAAAWKLVPLLLVTGAGGVSLLLAWRRWGLLASVQASYQVAALRAQHQPGQTPQSLTYSPHISLKQERSELPMLAAPGELEDAGVPSFAQLLDRGRVGKGNPLMLGFDAESGEELSGSWLDLYSTAVSGMPGSGKTTSQRFLACQTALHGAQFAICDPHAGAADDSLAATLAPLSAAFVCEPGSSDKAILEITRYVADVGRRRVEGKDQSTTPLILWVDELTSLLGRSSVADELAELLEKVAQEYRKRWVFVCASGQIWTAARTSSELRDSFASVLCHRMKRSQARLLLPTEEAEQAERLPTGSAVLWRTSGVTAVVRVPNTTAADCARVASLLADGRHISMPVVSQNEARNMPNDMPDGSLMVAKEVLAYSASESVIATSAEARRAAQLFLDGKDPAAIVQELRGVKTNEGRRYQVALTEVLGLIRQGVR